MLVFFMLSSATAWDVTLAPVPVDADASTVLAHQNCGSTEMPLGDAEENSEEDKDFTEDDDDVSLDHRRHSRKVSGDSGLQYLYQHFLFKDLEIKVIIPPPRA
jgi:hypothetical protein